MSTLTRRVANEAGWREVARLQEFQVSRYYFWFPLLLESLTTTTTQEDRIERQVRGVRASTSHLPDSPRVRIFELALQTIPTTPNTVLSERASSLKILRGSRSHLAETRNYDLRKARVMRTNRRMARTIGAHLRRIYVAIVDLRFDVKDAQDENTGEQRDTCVCVCACVSVRSVRLCASPTVHV